MDESELLVEKKISMFNRKKGRDRYDVWFLIKSGLKIDTELFVRKRPEGMAKLEYPSKYEYERDMKRLTNRMIPYDQVIKEVKTELDELIN